MVSNPPKKGKQPKGVRGPGGPQRSTPGPSMRKPGPHRAAPASSSRSSFERWSYPMVVRMHAMPRWLVVIAPAILLVGGLVVPITWLGALLLFLVFLMLAWLTALSWPVLTPGGRLIRSITVLALLGICFWKFTGRF